MQINMAIQCSILIGSEVSCYAYATLCILCAMAIRVRNWRITIDSFFHLRLWFVNFLLLLFTPRIVDDALSRNKEKTAMHKSCADWSSAIHRHIDRAQTQYMDEGSDATEGRVVCPLFIGRNNTHVQFRLIWTCQPYTYEPVNHTYDFISLLEKIMKDYKYFCLLIS